MFIDNGADFFSKLCRSDLNHGPDQTRFTFRSYGARSPRLLLGAINIWLLRSQAADNVPAATPYKAMLIVQP